MSEELEYEEITYFCPQALIEITEKVLKKKCCGGKCHEEEDGN